MWLSYQLHCLFLSVNVSVPQEFVWLLALPNFVVSEPHNNIFNVPRILPLVSVKVRYVALTGFVHLNRQNFVVEFSLIYQAHDSQHKVVWDGKDRLKLFPGQINDINCIAIASQRLITISLWYKSIVELRRFRVCSVLILTTSGFLVILHNWIVWNLLHAFKLLGCPLSYLNNASHCEFLVNSALQFDIVPWRKKFPCFPVFQEPLSGL